MQFACLAATCLILWGALGKFAHSQDPQAAPAAAADEAAPASAAGESAAEEGAPAKPKEQMNIAKLIFIEGGVWMIPLYFLSVLAVAFIVERFIGLRRMKIIPDELVQTLGKLGGPQGFDPRQAYRLCQQYPSSASNVIRAMLLKVGRPHSEVEQAVQEASDREANRLYANVRWLNLCAALGPMLGLLGTVWGMIVCFYDMTQLAPGANKAQELSSGIYAALVTTLGGLVVAIPSAFFSHWFEGKITSMFHQIDELLFNLLAQVERYEGRVRFSRHAGEGDAGASSPVGNSVPAEAEVVK